MEQTIYSRQYYKSGRCSCCCVHSCYYHCHHQMKLQDPWQDHRCGQCHGNVIFVNQDAYTQAVLSDGDLSRL